MIITPFLLLSCDITTSEYYSKSNDRTGSANHFLFAGYSLFNSSEKAKRNLEDEQPNPELKKEPGTTDSSLIPENEELIVGRKANIFANERFDEYSDVAILQTLLRPDFGDNIQEYYSHQLILAEQGSGVAAYELALLHSYCPYNQQWVNNPEAALKAAQSERQTFIDIGTTIDRNCIDMWLVASKRYEDWYKIAEESDFPVMQLKKADVEKYKNDISEMLGKAVATGNLQGTKSVTKFYKNIVADKTLTRTWKLIGCQTHSGCDQEKYKRFLEASFYQHEVETIVSEANKLTLMISNGEITNHEFKYRLDVGAEPFDIEKRFQPLSEIEKSEIEARVRQLLEDN